MADIREYRGLYQVSADKKEWVYGDIRRLRNADGTTKAFFISTPDGSFKVDPLTIGQFVGLQDVNGNDIYEGDILYNSRERYVVSYKKDWAAYVVRGLDEPDKDKNYLLDEMFNTPVQRLLPKVIGDIYTRPQAKSAPADSEIKTKLKIVYCEPEKQARVIEIEDELETLQRLVNDYIEVINLPEKSYILVCGETGRLRNELPNCAIRYNGRILHIIVGPFFFVGKCGEEFASLTDDEIKEILAEYGQPDIFNCENPA